jgi:maleate isomerase
MSSARKPVDPDVVTAQTTASEAAAAAKKLKVHVTPEASGLTFACNFTLARKRTLGLILLQTDETLEDDAKALFPAASSRVHHVRVPSDSEVSRESLLAMAGHIGAAAGLLPPAAAFDAIAYGCTSASSIIGSSRVADIIRSGRVLEERVAVTNPFDATVAACKALGAKRIGMVSPYVAEVSKSLIAAFEKAGVHVAHFGSFEQKEEAKVARIDEESLVAASVALWTHTRERDSSCSSSCMVGEVVDSFDAIFLSCTNLVTLGAIGKIEKATGIPTLSSNLCLCWHMAVLAGGGMELNMDAVGSSMLLESGYPGQR